MAMDAGRREQVAFTFQNTADTIVPAFADALDLYEVAPARSLSLHCISLSLCISLSVVPLSASVSRCLPVSSWTSICGPPEPHRRLPRQPIAS
eukprot:1017828-Rhodomonas_salina.1